MLRVSDMPVHPRWMGVCLGLASVYNIAWGAVMVALPERSLRMLGVNPSGNELWPQLWACIGMIVGVYGIGYAIAARDPFRHWPVVLCGLVGKVLGPIGFVDSAVRGTLPWSMGWTIITNDLMWWVPFGLILLGAWKANGRAGAARAA